jgi:hypothetical protein
MRKIVNINRLGEYLPNLFSAFILICFFSAKAQDLNGVDVHFRIPLEQLSSEETVKVKNYYLLSLMQQKELKKILLTDPSLSALAKKHQKQLQQALKDCEDTGCLLDALAYPEKDIETANAALRQLFRTSPILSNLVKGQLKPSGTYYQFNRLTPEDEFIAAWKKDIDGVNDAISVYGRGKAPHYPKIDSIAFDVHGRSYLNLLYDVVAAIADDPSKLDLFFGSSLEAALRLLEINERFDAANNEPMTLTENKAAFDRIKIMQWERYPYSLILVPGAGPEDPNVALSAAGMLRCRVAANRYKAGLAPFIMVSGGAVHPYKTKYIEAVEMKKYLIEVMQVPEEAILIEPHARHTTTNMRNCARIIYRYGIPSDKPAITSTDKYQSYYITNMDARCQKELGYVPYRLGKRLSDTEQEFWPLPQALQIDPTEPLDP